MPIVLRVILIASSLAMLAFVIRKVKKVKCKLSIRFLGIIWCFAIIY